MPAAGVDWAWGRPSEASLDVAGIAFVARYLSVADRTKTITAAEAARYLGAGRAIVLVYEDGAAAMLRGRVGGVTDATAADGQARAAGLAGAVIYFAADFDATEGQQVPIGTYLDGAASVIGRDRVGIYGGYWPLSRARAAGSATFYWGTPAWSGTNWDTCGWKPHIMQGGQIVIDGAECDRDTAWTVDYGQYPRPATDWTEEAIMALPILIQGDRDTPGQVLMVHRVQNDVAGVGRWNSLGPITAIKDDGVFGVATADAVKAVQMFFGITADGIVGPDTWRKLIGV